ncbi:MAG TPA: glycoside hydrolase family 76 protein [Solirubrobacteraceae bacterium]
MPHRCENTHAARWALAALVLAAVALPAAASASARYPAGATRALVTPGRGVLAFAHGARATSKKKKKKPAAPVLHGNAARAVLAFEALQHSYYVRGSGLYEGEPFSFLWPFSQAFGATVGMAEIPALKGKFNGELHARLVGLNNYLDLDNSGAPEGVYNSSLAAYDGTVAPPTGPGGTKYYDDNDWVGIELMRLYELRHEASVLGAAEGIMAFEMAGWQSSPELGCSGGVPFSNASENTDRNTITTAPAAELALQLYSATKEQGYLQFAEMAYEWVRGCLLEPNGMYGDHVNAQGVVAPMLWSYTQGAMIGAGAMLYRATGNSGFLFQARQTAAAALAYFTPARVAGENPFFAFVYFRNLMYLDSITHDPPGPKLAQEYVNYFWSHRRLADNLFVSGSPPSGNVLVQAVMAQLYALLASPSGTYF